MPLLCEGRCDSFGDLREDGAFVRLVRVTEDTRDGIVLTQPEALQLIAKIANTLDRTQEQK